jgi:hypothetical protein
MSQYDPIALNDQAEAADSKALRDRMAAEREAADIRWLMESEQGRRIVWRLLNQSGVFRSSFSSDALAMAFAEGNRNTGLQLMAQVHELCPDMYPEMVREANARDLDD